MTTNNIAIIDDEDGRRELCAQEDRDGWYVVDPSGGRWRPDEDMQHRLRRDTEDPEAVVIELCVTQPMRGEWVQ